jgi:hypothetical protein
VVLSKNLGRSLRSIPPVKRLMLSLLSQSRLQDEGVTVHPPSTADDSSASSHRSSGQASLRHPPAPAYGCFLPDLTGFAGWRRVGPDLQRSVPRAAPDHPGLGRGFSPARADCGYRAPLAPRLARSPAEYTRGWDETSRDRLYRSHKLPLSERHGPVHQPREQSPEGGEQRMRVDRRRLPVQNGKADSTLSLTAVFSPGCTPLVTVVFTDVTVTDTTNGLTHTFSGTF